MIKFSILFLILLFILLFVLLSVFVLLNYILTVNEKKNIYEKFEIKKYKEVMLNNNNEKLFKISLNNIPILEEDCFSKCDKANCIKLDQLKKKSREMFKM